jgi:hypothetical protein
MTEKEPEARDYSWYQTVARYIGGLGIHPPDPKDPKRLTCMERT